MKTFRRGKKKIRSESQSDREREREREDDDECIETKWSFDEWITESSSVLQCGDGIEVLSVLRLRTFFALRSNKR